MQHYTIEIEGMGCDGCIKAVERALTEVEGLEQLQVVLGQAKFNTKALNQATIMQALDEVGFKATFVND